MSRVDKDSGEWRAGISGWRVEIGSKSLEVLDVLEVAEVCLMSNEQVIGSNSLGRTRGIGFLPMQTMELCLVQKTGFPPIYNHKASMLFGGTGKTLLWLSASLAAKKGH